MSTFHVQFPATWAYLPTGGDGRRVAEEYSAVMAELDPRAQETAAAWFDGFLPLLEASGIDAFASLAAYDEANDATVQASCALAVLRREPTGNEAGELHALVEAGPHPGL